jgi:two-component system, chemotaxis family, chemotaxis protein CheY
MSRRILLADDHAGIRQRVRAALEAAGFDICAEAVNGLDAIQKTKDLQPDLIILNRSMPVMDGLDAIPEILTSVPRVKIVMFSVDDSEELRGEALRRGAHGYVIKSTPIEVLINKINKLLGNP